MPHVSSAIKWYTILAIAYLSFALLLPANKVAMHNYNLTSGQYHVLMLVVLIPYVAIWFAAFYGYAKLQEYASKISSTPEGPGFKSIANGFQWLAWGLPVPALISLFLSTIADAHQGFLPASLIIANYLSVLVALVAFIYIGQGTRVLTGIAQTRLNNMETRVILAIFLLIGVAFCFFTFQHLNLKSVGSASNPYHLPGWLLITTVIVPYLFAWFSGLLAAYEMLLYGRVVSGVFYRQAMRLLAAGMTSVIASLIFVQYIRSVTPRSGHLSLNSTLLLVNIVYVCMAVGFLLMSIAAARLKRIEEV
jgi:hypothetical protein